MLRGGRTGHKRLVAYLVRDGPQQRTGELRARLLQQLPEYMIPSAFVRLDKPPLTSNGKIDRKALPRPEEGTREGVYVAPRTTVEEILAGIWAEVLKLDRVGIQDIFFELGGHSLLATQVQSRLRQATGMDVPMRI